MELFSLHLLFFPSLVLLIFVFLTRRNPAKRSTSTGHKSHPVLGSLVEFIKNRHRFLDWVTQILVQNPTHTMTFRSPGQTSGIITANPLNVEHMLKTNFANYPKGDRSISMLEDFLGHGIFNSDGEHWNWQRKAASFEFNKRSLRNFVVGTVHLELAQRLLPLLARAAEEEEVVDLQDVLERFAFDNICKVAFGEDPACLSLSPTSSSSDFMKAFGDAQALIADRFMDALEITWRIKRLLHIGSEKRLKRSISVVDDFALKIIRSRKEEGAGQTGSDLLSRFASNKDHTEEVLRDTVISFIIAGRETTSAALTWFFWLLSSRPDVVDKILDEVRSVRAVNPNSGEAFTFDELREMSYLHAAITESMRLYPPVPLDSQSCLEDDTMPDGTFVGKGWFVTYSAYAMGRMEDIWGEDCREYKPERWLEMGVFKPESPFRYPVFHAGPRMCLGKEMAYIQMRSIAACVVERFEIDAMVAKGKTPDHILSLTLRMKGGLPIRVRKRRDLTFVAE